MIAIEGRISMFTIEQINDLHVRLGSARTLPEYVRALNVLGVERYDSSFSTCAGTSAARRPM
jgi:hypothetical protein